MGFTFEEASQFCGKSVSTIQRWKGTPEFDAAIAATEAANSIAKSKQLSKVVYEAVETAEERIKNIFTRATRLTEKAVERVEALGDNATLEQLMDMHKQITVWASKYVASEAPKRMQFEGSVEHTYKAVISLEEARSIAEADRLFERTEGPKLIAGASEVIDITPDA